MNDFTITLAGMDKTAHLWMKTPSLVDLNWPILPSMLKYSKIIMRFNYDTFFHCCNHVIWQIVAKSWALNFTWTICARHQRHQKTYIAQIVRATLELSSTNLIDGESIRGAHMAIIPEITTSMAFGAFTKWTMRWFSRLWYVVMNEWMSKSYGSMRFISRRGTDELAGSGGFKPEHLATTTMILRNCNIRILRFFTAI